MQTVRSADGTPIAFDRAVEGPALILVAGALQDRSAARALGGRAAAWLSPCTTTTCGAVAPAGTPARMRVVDREIADLTALVAEAGGAAFVFGHSSGAVLALRGRC